MKKINYFLVIFWLVPMLLLASDNSSDNITVPHIFSSGTTISSSQMNENFTKLLDIINNLKNKIDNSSSHKKDGIAMFTTSSTYESNSSILQSRELINNECSLEIAKINFAKINLKNCNNIHALISINSSDKISNTNFIPDKPIYSIDGSLILDNYSKLLSGESLFRPLDSYYGFNGNTFTGYTYLNKGDGSTDSTCINWTTDNLNYWAVLGTVTEKNNILNGGQTRCNNSHQPQHVFCVCY